MNTVPDADRRRWLRAGLAGGGAALLSAQAAGAALDAGEGWGTAPPRPAAALPPMVWPALRLVDGEVWTPESWVGQGAVVVVFATWCGFCQRHNAHVQALHRARPGLRVLGLAQDGPEAKVQAYRARQGHRFPVVLDVGGPLRARLTPRRTLPMTLLLDGRGRVVQAIPGEMFEADVLALNPPA